MLFRLENVFRQMYQRLQHPEKGKEHCVLIVLGPAVPRLKPSCMMLHMELSDHYLEDTHGSVKQNFSARLHSRRGMD